MLRLCIQQASCPNLNNPPDTEPRPRLQQVGRALRAAPGKRRCLVLDMVGATYKFGPITGPPASDYAFETSRVCALGAAKGARAAAAVRRCADCGNLRHRDLLSCPGCAEAATAAASAATPAKPIAPALM